MIQMARALGLDHAGLHDLEFVSVTAAAHLSPLVDYADLDGNLLIANDPFVGVSRRGTPAAEWTRARAPARMTARRLSF